MYDPYWSEFPNPGECFKVLSKKLERKSKVDRLESKVERLESKVDLKLEKLELEKLYLERQKLDLELEKLDLERQKLKHFDIKLVVLRSVLLGLKHKLTSKLNLNGFLSQFATVKKSNLTNFLLEPASFTGIPRLIFLDHSKRITSKGEHEAREELQQNERLLQKHQEIFFEIIKGGDWHNGEIIENEFEYLKLSLKMLEMLKHLVQSTFIEPMRDAVVLMTLIYIVVLSYSLTQVRNDWLIHFLVLCAFVCLHIGSYFSEKAANYFYRVEEMEKKLVQKWPHDVVLYLQLAFPTCILLSR